MCDSVQTVCDENAHAENKLEIERCQQIDSTVGGGVGKRPALQRVRHVKKM